MRLPIMISGTITDASGRTLSGQTAEAFWNSVRHAKPLSVGFNCALGAKQLRPYVEELSRIADVYVSAHPNAGLPNAMAEYDETPAETAGYIREWAESGWLNIIGGCCGTTPDHIRAIAEVVSAFTPRTVPQIEPKLRLSGLEPLNIGDDSLFVNVGERTNVTGSQGVRAPDPRRRLRRGARGRAPAGGERRAGDRRQHGRGDARLGGGHDALPAAHRLRARHLARAGHDRLLEVERDRGGLEVRAGQVRSSTRSR